MPLLVETMNSNYKSATRSFLRKWRLAQSIWINPEHFALSSAVGKTFPLLQVTWATSLQFPGPIQIPIWCCQGCIQHSSAEPSLLPASEARQHGPVYSWKGLWLTEKKKKKQETLYPVFITISLYGYNHPDHHQRLGAESAETSPTFFGLIFPGGPVILHHQH